MSFVAITIYTNSSGQLQHYLLLVGYEQRRHTVHNSTRSAGRVDQGQRKGRPLGRTHGSASHLMLHAVQACPQQQAQN